MALDYLIDESVIFCRLGLVNNVVIVNTDHRLVGRNLNNVEGVDLLEFLALRHSRTCHTRQLLVKTEIILECNCGERLTLVLDLNAFLCFDSLMQTFVIASAEHDTSCELVNDKNLIVLDNIVDVTAHNADRLDSLIDVVHKSHIVGVHEVVNVEICLCLGNTALGKRSRSCLLVNDIVAVGNVLGVLLGVDLLDDSL